MKAVRIYQLNHLMKTQFERLQAAQQEAAAVWNLCMQTHQQARMAHKSWPGENELHQLTKGKFAPYSQSVQQITRAFLANGQRAQIPRLAHCSAGVQVEFPRSFTCAVSALSKLPQRGRRLRVRTSLGYPTDLEPKGHGDKSMSGTRLNPKAWSVTRRKSCAQEISQETEAKPGLAES